MNVIVSRPTLGELCFAFDTDSTDAIVPLPTVWFRHNAVGEMGTLPIALMAYLMARPFIGNSFTLSGHPLPAHLAARMQQDLHAHEFFVGSVTNVPERILPDFQYEALDACDAEDEGQVPREGAASLICRRNELGYVLEARPCNESPLLSIATNVDLFTAFTDRPTLRSLVLIYLCAFDVLGIKSLRLGPVADSQWSTRMSRLLAEIGAGLESSCYEPARCA
jgi:hypothetical protein